MSETIIPSDIVDEMRDSYMEYAMSVIVGRALPDVRDGLKPVHRRVLFSMNEQGNDFNKPFRKSARVVGDVIGKYHPHGDSAVYDTIVRMTQAFSMRWTGSDPDPCQNPYRNLQGRKRVSDHHRTSFHGQQGHAP